MAVSSLTAARHACYQTGWNLTQLSLQKILYVAHMRFYGKTGEHLIAQPFQAWTFGPVEPNLYQSLSQFGARRIDREVFGNKRIVNESMRNHLTETVNELESWTPAQLVAYTHERDSAWWNTYDPSARNLIIRDEYIKAEFDWRQSRGGSVD